MKKNKNYKKGMKWEKTVQRTISSGNKWFNPGDLTLGTKYNNYVIECKETDKKGFRISDKLLNKIWSEALDNAKLPLIVLRIQDYKLTIQISKLTGR